MTLHWTREDQMWFMVTRRAMNPAQVASAVGTDEATVVSILDRLENQDRGWIAAHGGLLPEVSCATVEQ